MKKKKLTMMILMLLVSSCSIEGITINKGSASNSNETPSVSSKPTTITIPASDFNSQYGSVTPIEKITVVYNANGGRFDDGEPVKVEEYEINSTITFPSKPKREGYSFVGWSTSRDEYVAFTSDLGNFDGRSITVYAFWTKSPFIEEFEGAEIDEESKTITLLVANDVNHLALPQMITIDDLFAFKVYKDPLMTEEIKSKTLTTDDGTLVDGDNEYTLRVYSLLASTKYTLKIHKSHAITLSYMNGETLLKTDNFFSGYDKNVDYVPEIKGYNFIEWRDATGLKVTTINSRNDVTVYAYLSAKDYEVSLNSDGGTLVNDKIILTYDSLGSIQVPVKEGSTFSGWYYGNERITNENGDLLTKWNIDEEDIVLTAKYDLNSYELIVNNANENMGTVLGSGTYPYDTTAYLKAVPNKGYVFIGWFDSEDNKISDELDYSFVVKKDTTITAKFDYVNISINYYVDGKLVKTDSVNIDNLPSELYVYDAGEDKEFKGWYKDSDYKNKIDTISSDLLDGSNINLYGYVQIIENIQLKYEIKDDTYCKVIGFEDDSTKESVDKIVVSDKKMIDGKQYIVDEIESEAFNGCASLTSITIPSNVTKIGNYAFLDCFLLTNVYYEGTIEDWCNIEFGDEFSNPMSHAKHFYMLNSNNEYEEVTNIEIPEIVTKIGDYQFYRFNNVTSITLQSSVTTIGKLAFAYCTSLKSITIPNSVTTIGELAFAYCTSLKSITIPNSVTTIGELAFAYCTSLTSVTIPSSVATIGYRAFGKCSFLTICCEATSQPSGWDSNWNEDNRPVYYGITKDNKIEKDGIIYVIQNNEAIVAEYVGNDTNVIIPSTIELNGKTYSVTTIGNSTFLNCTSLTSITIPSSVTEIGYRAFYNCTALTSIYIPSSITAIGNGAFAGCTSLTSITLPSSVTTIGEYAFSGCFSLTIYCESISQPSGWESYWNGGRPVYYGITKDNKVEIDGIIYVIQNNEAIVTRYIGNDTSITILDFIELNGKTYKVTTIGEDAFSYCKFLTSIVLPNGVKTISRYSFNECTSLASIIIPSSVTEIGYRAFYNCTALTSIYIPSSVTTIGNSTFFNCTSLTSITIPSSVTTIGEYAFSGCFSLTIYCESISQPSGWESYWNGGRPVYYGITKDNKIEKDGIIYVLQNDEAIVTRYVGNDTNVTIPSTIELNGKTYKVTTIGESAFSYCKSLTSITIPSSITAIGNGAFAGCTSLTSITLPSSVTTIGESSFRYCTSLTSITIPNGVTAIGEEAFDNCTSLTNGYYEGTIEDWCNIKFGSYTSNPMSYAKHFYMLNSNNEYEEVTTNITIQISIKTIGDFAFSNCTSLENVYYEGTIEDWCNIKFGSYTSNPMSYAKHFYMLNSNNEYEEVTSIEIPDIITSIGDYQFGGFNNVTNVTIRSVETIGSYAFSDCTSLTSIELPNSVTTIGWGAFAGCTSLEKITLPFIGGSKNKNTYLGYMFGALSYRDNSNFVPSSLKEVIILEGCTSIGAYAFRYCTSLTSITLPSSVTEIGISAFNGCASLTSITIPSSVTEIGEGAFYNCTSLTSITIPSSVTAIGYFAFSNCTSLTNVYYEGAIEDWCNITFSNEYSNPMSYARHFYMLNSNNKYEEVTSIEIPETVTKIGKYQFYGFNNITSIIIPSSVETIGYRAFVNCTSLTIYCEAESEPSGWNSNWNPDNRPVIWGYNM